MSKKEKIMRKTKIVCTIGPACDSKEKIKSLIFAGMNVARINLSHGGMQSHKQTIDNLKFVRSQLHTPLAIMLDTKGPEIRIKNFENGFVNLEKNQIFTLTTNEVIGNQTIVSLAYKNLVNQVKIGDKIYANNGMIKMKVTDITSSDIICKVLFGGKLTNGKGLNIPNISPIGDYLSKNDKDDLLFAAENDVDIIAASFVSKSSDVVQVKDFLKKHNCNAKIIAKIENGEGVKNTKDILQHCDGIMVARGDLGIEIPLERVPIFQKKAIKLCNQLGKISIVATEMLESMTNSLRPTRAEVSDCANAIFEKTCATMLSGETAVGVYPQNTTKTMSKILIQSEKNINYNKDISHSNFNPKNQNEVTCFDTITTAIKTNAKLVVTLTDFGESAQMLSKFKFEKPIVAITTNPNTFNQLAISWGVKPIFLQNIPKIIFADLLKNITLENKLATKGDKIIFQNEFNKCTIIQI